jgi:uroporphyrinogen decarboxylase
MGALSGRKRISAAFKATFSKEKLDLDRVPAYLFTGQCNGQLVGASIRQLLQDPNVFVKAQIAAYERYKPDILLMMWDLLTDVEAFGNEMKFPEHSLCFSTKHSLENKGKLSSLEVPDPTRDGRLPGYVEAVAQANKIVTDSIVSAVIAGPWTIAVGLRGAEDLLKDCFKDPTFVLELMELCVQASMRNGESLHPLGVGLGYSEAPASCSLISPKIYRKFVLPYHERLVAHFEKKKVGLGLHICGQADPIVEDMVNTGWTNISVDAPTDLAKAAAAARGKAVLIGNLDTGLFYSGSKARLKQAIEGCLERAPKDSGFILASGCEVPGVAPPEQVDWFTELIDEVGQPR